MSCGVYKITNLINGKNYVGQSIHIEKRWQQHCQKSSHSLISRAIQKYGKENFSFEILEETDNTNLLTVLETKYIKKYNLLVPNGYNIILEDEQEYHSFSRYDSETFADIIDKIKNSTLSFQQIAKIYNLDVSMIYYLNRGDYHTLTDEKYPLRPVESFQKKKHFCVDCGCEIFKGSTRCEKCSHLNQRKSNRPSRELLKQEIRQFSFKELGRKYGITDNGIRRWCDSFHLPRTKKEILSYSDIEWDMI